MPATRPYSPASARVASSTGSPLPASSTAMMSRRGGMPLRTSFVVTGKSVLARADQSPSSVVQLCCYASWPSSVPVAYSYREDPAGIRASPPMRRSNRCIGLLLIRLIKRPGPGPTVGATPGLFPPVRPEAR